MKRLVLTLLSILILCANSDCFQFKEGAPAEDYLAVADGIDPDLRIHKITINRYRTLMNTLSERLNIDKDTLLGQCHKAKGLLEEQGIKESCLNIMEAIFRATNLDQTKSFSGYAADYIGLRTTGLTHDKAVSFMISPAYELFKYRTN